MNAPSTGDTDGSNRTATNDGEDVGGGAESQSDSARTVSGVRMVDVKVRTLDRNVYELRVASDMPITAFKALVKERSGIEEDRQRIIFRGKMLKDSETLASHKVENGHVLQLCARPLTAPPARRQQDDDDSTDRANEADRAGDVRGSAIDGNGRPVVIATQLASALGGGLGLPISRLRGGNFARPQETRMEHVWQGLLTLNTLMSTMSIESVPTRTNLDWRNCPTSLSHPDADEEEAKRSDAGVSEGDIGVEREVVATTRVDETNHQDDVAEDDDRSGEVQQTRLASELASAFNMEAEDHNNSDDRGDVASTNMEGSSTSSSEYAIAEDSKRPSLETRKFFVGQWLDVKDTVNQWLEATVMRMSTTRLYIHYNGWPNRWDEWIHITSDRISPFRTKTLHPQTAPHMSPSPVSWVRDAPTTGPNDVRPLIASVQNMVSKTMPMIVHFRNKCIESERRDFARVAADVEGGATKEDTTNEMATVEEDGADDTKVSHRSRAEEEELRIYAHELAPVLDRLGRIISDLAPHVAELGQRNRRRNGEEGVASSDVRGDAEVSEPARHASIVRRPHIEGESVRADEPNLDSVAPGNERRDGNGPETNRAVDSADTGDIEEDTENGSFLRLISTPSNSPHLARQQGNVDIHIHAILTPWRNALAAAADRAGAEDLPAGMPALPSLPLWGSGTLLEGIKDGVVPDGITLRNCRYKPRSRGDCSLPDVLKDVNDMKNFFESPDLSSVDVIAKQVGKDGSKLVDRLKKLPKERRDVLNVAIQAACGPKEVSWGGTFTETFIGKQSVPPKRFQWKRAFKKLCGCKNYFDPKNCSDCRYRNREMGYPESVSKTQHPTYFCTWGAKSIELGDEKTFHFFKRGKWADV
eukprot:g4854.t1